MVKRYKVTFKTKYGNVIFTAPVKKSRRGGRGESQSPFWRKWADERFLMYDTKTGKVIVYGDYRYVCNRLPHDSDPLCTRVRASVLKLMSKEAMN